MGVGEGTDNMDFLADLSALKVIEPEEVARARPDNTRPVPSSRPSWERSCSCDNETLVVSPHNMSFSVRT